MIAQDYQVLKTKREMTLGDRRRFTWAPLIFLIAASFTIRIIAWAYLGTGTIESEGAEYAKIAENLRSGNGYVGLVFPGPQVMFPPLFSWLIAGVSVLTHDYETAGRIVALVLGTLLPLPVFGIASRLFNRTVGFIAGVLALLHPLLVHLSFMVLSEGPYATLLLSAVFVVVVALEAYSTKLWLLVGGAFGLCYLLRAEALAPFAISLLFAILATNAGLGVRLGRAAAALVIFLAVALPEVSFIYQSTGKVELEAKSTVLSYMGKRILAARKAPGVDYLSAGGVHDIPTPELNAGGDPWEVQWANYGIDSNLRGTGAAMRPFAEVARDEPASLKGIVPFVIAGISKNVPVLFSNFSAGWLGAPLLPALALLGVFRRPWRSSRARGRLFVLLVTANPVLATVFVLWDADARYYFIFVPFLCIWAASGLFEISLWIKSSGTTAGWRRGVRYLGLPWIIPGLLGFATIVSPVRKVITLYEFSNSGPRTSVDKDVGIWIGRKQARPIRVMDLTLPLSYHAGAQQHLYFPYSTGDTAIRYLDAAKVDYIVLRRGMRFTQYYDEWLAHGIPSSNAELVQLPSIVGADKFVIYRWHPTVY
jgi:4-amino-4-deoxy-L-arabinose transferase-like glycosyltransferase